MPEQYKTINDASNISDILSPGKTEIWYSKSMRLFLDGAETADKLGVLPKTKDELKNTHVLIGKIKGDKDLDKIFSVMQGETWSPGGAARNLISDSATHHTSMSVGDIIKQDEKYYMVDTTGFNEIEIK